VLSGSVLIFSPPSRNGLLQKMVAFLAGSLTPLGPFQQDQQNQGIRWFWCMPLETGQLAPICFLQFLPAQYVPYR
jgi:hypothetical protein